MDRGKEIRSFNVMPAQPSAPMVAPQTMEIERAAALLGVPQQQVSTWLAQGQLAAVRQADGQLKPSAADVQRLHAELHGVPDLRFDEPNTPTPCQIDD